MISLPKNVNEDKIKEYLLDLVTTLENQTNSGPQLFVVDSGKRNNRYPRNPRRRDLLVKIRKLSGIDKINLYWYDGKTWQPLELGSISGTIDPSQIEDFDFLHLTDTPDDYTGKTLNLVRVNVGETALEFVDNINDYLPDQTGLGGYCLKADGTGGLTWNPDIVGPTTFLALGETPNSFAGASLQAVRVNVGETSLEFYTPSTGGVTAFIALSDVPSSFTGASLKAVRVNVGETALEFYTPSTGVTTFVALTDTPANFTGSSLKAVRVNVGESALEFYTPTIGAVAFTGLSDVPASYAGGSLKAVRVNVGETALEFYTPSTGVTAFTGLSDVPASYSGQGGKGVRVNAGATALEFYTLTTIPIMSRVNSSAYEASRVIKNSAGTLRAVFGYNSGPAQFIQLHDAASVPADTAVPCAVISVDAAKSFAIAIDTYGIPFTTGIVVCNSTTGPTKTIGAANCYFTGIYD